MVVGNLFVLLIQYLSHDVHHVLEFDARVLAMVVTPVLAIMGYLLVGLQTRQQFS